MGNSDHTLIIINAREQIRKKLTLTNQKKKWKTGQKLVMNNNILDIRRHGGRSPPTPTSNKGEPRPQGQRSPGQLMPMKTPQRIPKKSKCIIFKFINIQILTCINNIKL